MSQGEIPIAGTCATCVFWTDGYCGKWTQPTMPGSGCSEGILDPKKVGLNAAATYIRDVARLQERVAELEAQNGRLRELARAGIRLRRTVKYEDDAAIFDALVTVAEAMHMIQPGDLEG